MHLISKSKVWSSSKKNNLRKPLSRLMQKWIKSITKIKIKTKTLIIIIIIITRL
jgi:hypothetical protein